MDKSYDLYEEIMRVETPESNTHRRKIKFIRKTPKIKIS